MITSLMRTSVRGCVHRARTLRSTSARALGNVPSMRRMLPGRLLLPLLAGGCGGLGLGARDAVPVANVTAARLQAGDALAERSAAATSVAHGGVVYTINDSGHDAVLFAFDTAGADRGRWTLTGARNRDWEAVAVARCGGDEEGWCVHVADVGDNDLQYETVTIYRVREPTPLGAGASAALVPDSVVVRYADGPHNVESLYIAPDGALMLLTKEGRRAADGGMRPTLLYRVAPPSWREAAPADAVLLDSLPIVPRSAPRRSVTDAALAPDGATLAVRTYRELYLFGTDPLTGRPRPDVAPSICDLSALGEPTGEGVGFVRGAGATGRVVLTSEGERQPLLLADCPLPAAAAGHRQ